MDRVALSRSLGACVAVHSDPVCNSPAAVKADTSLVVLLVAGGPEAEHCFRVDLVAGTVGWVDIPLGERVHTHDTDHLHLAPHSD